MDNFNSSNHNHRDNHNLYLHRGNNINKFHFLDRYNNYSNLNRLYLDNPNNNLNLNKSNNSLDKCNSNRLCLIRPNKCLHKSNISDLVKCNCKPHHLAISKKLLCLDKRNSHLDLNNIDQIVCLIKVKLSDFWYHGINNTYHSNRINNQFNLSRTNNQDSFSSINNQNKKFGINNHSNKECTPLNNYG